VALGAPPRSDIVVDIGAAEIEFFAANGDLAIERVTSNAEIDWLRGVYDTLMARPRTGLLDEFFDPTRPYGSLTPPRLAQLLAPERFVPEMRETAAWRNAQHIAARLLGAPLADVGFWGHLIFKAPCDGAETPWHQDEAYWDPGLDYHAIASWLPLQDVDVHNGCLWFLPGSHRAGIVDHRHCGGDAAVHLLETCAPLDTHRAVPVPLARGGMTFHHPRILHFAGGNRSSDYRCAWAHEFQTKPRRRATPAERPWVIEGERALAARLDAVRART
jgi:hypothetical protein